MLGRGYGTSWNKFANHQQPRSGKDSLRVSASLMEMFKYRALGQDMVTLYSKNPWFYLSLISSDFCSSLKIFTNTSWKLCSHTMFLSCLLSCHGKETSSLDTSCAPGADNICKERIIPECKVVTSGWCLSLLCPQSIRDTSNFTVPTKSTARLMRNFLGRRL